MRVITKLTKNLIHQRNYSHKFTFLYNSSTHVVCSENNPITERENARKTCTSEVQSNAMLGTLIGPCTRQLIFVMAIAIINALKHPFPFSSLVSPSTPSSFTLAHSNSTSMNGEKDFFGFRSKSVESAQSSKTTNRVFEGSFRFVLFLLSDFPCLKKLITALVLSGIKLVIEISQESDMFHNDVELS